MPEIEDEGFAPIPSYTEGPTAEQELSLQDALSDAPSVSVGAEPPVPLGRAPAYDFVQHRMVPGAAGGPLMTRGIETLQTWVQKCIRTRRGENEAVDADFGVDVMAEDVLEEGGAFDPSLVAEYLAAVERALQVHPRIESIEDLEVDGDSDSDAVYLSFIVVLEGDDTDPLTFTRLPVGA